MCNNVLFDDRAGTASNQGELAMIIGINNIVMEKEAVFKKADCLCPVNLPETAKNAGYEQNRLDADGKYDAFNYHWRKSITDSDKVEGQES